MSIEEEDEFRKNLVQTILRIDLILVNYLIDNFAFNKSFINKILMSDKLKSFRATRDIFL
jgi:hypothetical protein